MKSLLLILAVTFFTVSTMGAFTLRKVHVEDYPVPAVQQADLLKEISVKKLQAYLGRKLTIKEKIQLFYAKKLVKASDPEDDELAQRGRSNAYTAFGFGLASIFLFPLFAIPALILSKKALAYDKEKPGILGDAKGFAKAGQIMGWVGLGILILAFVIIVAVLATWDN
jgi:hypothetical protein